ncbi:MAG: hypothetical protein KatS3mg068_1795 [Candidatus Sericytochromatia bacterium]|nr:MAG: hypothetical protein KatS3mg068_1795 [Candidatus Sericytochromatia bacterium]
MELLLKLLILLPFIGYILSFFTPSKKENSIYVISITTIILQFLAFLYFGILWGISKFPDLSTNFLNLYKADDYISISLFFDSLTCAYLIVTFFITFAVLLFSRAYIHREKGYKRFFNNTLLFYLGLNFILLAGNFETLFIGWEMIGVGKFFFLDKLL